MTNYVVVEPEVAGGLGPNTVMDRTVHPPAVSRLHYIIDGWLGDELIETFPCFLVTESLAARLLADGVVGAEFCSAEVSAAEDWRQRSPGRVLPVFLWMKISGRAGRDDFGTTRDGRLVLSSKALAVIQPASPHALEVFPFE